MTMSCPVSLRASAPEAAAVDIVEFDGDEGGRMETIRIREEYPKYRSCPFSSVVSRGWPAGSTFGDCGLKTGRSMEVRRKASKLSRVSEVSIVECDVTGRSAQSWSIF